jgi:uncharacterized glyoxalase superfamily protein PhnB
VEDFYKIVFDFVRKTKTGSGQELKTKAEEAQHRIVHEELDPSERTAELAELFRYVGSLLYWRGYKDAHHHRNALNRVQRTPQRHDRFNKAVTDMLEHDLEMKVKEICDKLQQDGVPAEFDIDGQRERFGPNRNSWIQRRVPRAIKTAIERIRKQVRSATYARDRQLLLSLSAQKRAQGTEQRTKEFKV